MPFLALPVRPGYWNGWLVYGLIVASLLGLAGHFLNFFFSNRWRTPSLLDVLLILLFPWRGLFSAATQISSLSLSAGDTRQNFTAVYALPAG